MTDRELEVYWQELRDQIARINGLAKRLEAVEEALRKNNMLPRGNRL